MLRWAITFNGNDQVHTAKDTPYDLLVTGRSSRLDAAKNAAVFAAIKLRNQTP